MSIFKTTFWNGIAVAIRLSTGLVLNKILAVLVGPVGYAVIGQFQNAMMILFSVSAGAINGGVTKYTTEYEGDPDAQARLWSTATRIVLFASLAVAAAVAALHRPLAVYFLGDETFSTVFLWLAASIVLFTLNTMLVAIVNGKKDLKTYVAINITGSAVILVSMAALTWLFGLYGALVALATNQAVVFFATLALCWRKDWFRGKNLFGRFSGAMARNLLMFAVMAAVSAVSNNLGQVGVRHIIASHFGWNFAGYWDGMIRISQLNMLLVATTMAFYFIPRMSELRYWDDIRDEILAGCKVIMPVFAAGAVAAFVLRDTLVHLLFTGDFLPMESLFGWQLAGDTVRVASWFLAYVMLGKAMTRLYIGTEILTNLLFVGLSAWLAGAVGFHGVAMAYFLTYLAAILGMFVAIRRWGRLPRRTQSDSAGVA